MAARTVSMDLPIVDLDLYLSGDPASEDVRQECKKVCTRHYH